MNKNHDALPVPDTEVFARPLGKLQYSCPNCGQQHPFRPVQWRRLNLHCPNCGAKYQFGLGFSRERGADAYLMGKWNSYTANRLNPNGTPTDCAKLYGNIEWACPSCAIPQQSFLDHDGLVQCSCGAEYFISVLFYRLPNVSRLKLRAPFDSLVKGLHEAKTIQPISAPTSDQGSGTSSSSAGGHR